MKKIIICLTALLVAFAAQAQRRTERLDRGLVATPSGTSTLVSWRIFAEEYYDTEYNLYRDGQQVATGLKVSNYLDREGTPTSRYQVAAVVRGTEQTLSDEVVRWTADPNGVGYHDIVVKPVYARGGTDVTTSHQYFLNDISLTDVTGDGVTEFLVRRLNGLDLTQMTNDSCFSQIECYTMSGERLWWIDLGPNMLAGADGQFDAVGYDWDGDGRDEVLMRGSDNMIIHTADGTTVEVGDMTVDTRWEGIEYTNSGNEYLLYLDGATGKPYVIMDYPLPRLEAGETDLNAVWGDGYGHRSTKHFFGAPYLDGRRPSIFLGRGIYTREKMVALDVDPQTHRLTERWRWHCYAAGSPWIGQGYHNFAISDVDWDGRDEIVYGSMVIDDNGKGLSTTGLGHGDAQHCGDLDPYRHGQEQFACNEYNPSMNFRNATTSEIYYRLQSSADDGRALCGNFSNRYPGCMGRSTQTGMVSTVADKIVGEVGELVAWNDLNFRIYWDGDLLDEVLNSPGTEKDAVIIKPGSGRIFTSYYCSTINYTKNNPCAQGDILGDWREEVVLRAENNTRIRIYTTPHYTTYRIPTLWHDHQYRQAMVWQTLGYNQPPHPSFFLGQMEGITQAPPPLTMTGRTEVSDGQTITSALDDKHLIVCEMDKDTEITVTEGATPYMMTFNVPSWVQGTADSDCTEKATEITRIYRTCTVKGAAFTGSMRLVKQGDGILRLPATEQLYTGDTDVWAGTLEFDGSLLQSPLKLGRFSRLVSNGGSFSTIRMEYAAELHPGGEGTKGTVSAKELHLGFGTMLHLDLFSNDLSCDVLKLDTLSIEKKAWEYGPQYLSPVIRFTVHGSQDGDTAPASGRYLIAEVTKIGGSIADIRLEGLGTSRKTTLIYEDSRLYLQVEDVRASASVVWNGQESNVWDFAKAANFSLAGASAVGGEFFVTGDDVLFADGAQQTTVDLTEQLEADTVLVGNETGTYTFSGQGGITGASTLVKRGAGSLVIETDNNYTGGTRISGGTVSVSSLANEYQKDGNLGLLQTDASKFVLENGAVLHTPSVVTQGSPMTMLGTEGGIVRNDASFMVAAPITGTRLTKEGKGTMQLQHDQQTLQTLVVKAGTVECLNVAIPARKVEYQGGALNESGSSSYAIHVPEGKSGTWNLASRADYSNLVTGSGTLTVYCPVVVGNGWNATRTSIKSNWSKFEGTIKCTVYNEDTRFTLDNSYGIPLGTLNIPEGVEIQNTGKTFAVGRVTGNGHLGGTCSFSSAVLTAANTWQVGNDENWSWSGGVTSNANFEKVGEGKLTYKGKSDHTGSTTVSTGQLHLSANATLGSGVLTVDKEATLSGESALTNRSVIVNGTVQPGITSTASSGIISFNDAGVSFSTGSVLRVGVRACATPKSTGCAQLTGIKRLVMNGKVSVFLSSAYKPAVGDSVRIAVAERISGTPSFDLPTLPDGLCWDTSDFVSCGLLRIADSASAIHHSVVEFDENSSVSVYSMQGTLLRSNVTLRNALRQLPTGIYLIQNENDGRTVKLYKE